MALLGFVEPARGQADDEPARRAYEMGWEFLQANRFSEALDHYERSYALAARPRTLYNIGLCKEKLGRVDEALAHYSEFLRIAEARDDEFKDLARERIEEIHARGLSTIEVTSTPSGQAVYLDESESPVGQTPVTLRVSPGTHALALLKKEGGPKVRRRVDARAGKTHRESFTGSARIVITVIPKDAEIVAEDGSSNTKGTLRADVAPGKHSFSIRREGFQTETIYLDVDTGTRYERVVQLQSVTGLAPARLHVETARDGATVSVDGLVVGTTRSGASVGGSVYQQIIAAGEHVVTVDSSSTTVHRKVHFSPGETVTLRAAFPGHSTLRSGPVIWGLAGVGVVGLVAGGTYGTMALRDASSSDMAERDRSTSRAWISDALILGGLAAVVGSVYLGSTDDPSLKETRTHHDAP